MQYAFALEYATYREFWEPSVPNGKPFRAQLLKWIGNKQRMADDIIRFFPNRIRTYREPFLGSGGVLGVLAPRVAVGSDSFKPVIEIWRTLRYKPALLKSWYAERWHFFHAGSRVEQYEKILASYNVRANGADLLLSLSETLYAWRAGANRVMLTPNGRCSGAAVGCANQLVSLKRKA